MLLAKVMPAPEPLNAVLTVIGAVRLVMALNATVSLVVVMLLAVWIGLLEVKFTAPSEVMEVPAKVRVPAVAFKVTTPLLVVVTGLLRVMF